MREYKEENTKLKHNREILGSIIENLEEENKSLKSNLAKWVYPHEDKMKTVEHILYSNHEIKEEPLDYYELTQRYSNCESCSNTFSGEEDLKLHMKVKHEKISHNKLERNHPQPSNFVKNVIRGTKPEPISKREYSKASGSSMSPNSNKILHKCEICDKIFTFRKNLLAHIRAIHEYIKSNK